MALGEAANPEVVLEAAGGGPPALSIDDAVGVVRALLVDHWDAESAKIVVRIEGGRVVVEHHAEKSFRRGAS